METVTVVPPPAEVPAPAPAASQPVPSTITALQAAGPPPTESTLPKAYHEAYRMRLAGEGMQQIADRFAVDRTTVWRWMQKVESEAQEQLANEPVFNILTREILRLTDLEEQNRQAAETAKTDRARVAYLCEARRAAVSRQALLVTTGIVPKVPEQIFRVTAEMKPDDGTRSKSEERLPRGEAIEEIISAMQRSRAVE